jgi:hypothetical protein
MSNKLYIFGIGGTGSRVLNSLTMLLASGVTMDVDCIVPIIIDPDASLGDLEIATQLIDRYCNIYSTLSHAKDAKGNPECGFFNTEINKIFKDGWCLKMSMPTEVTFGEYIKANQINDEGNKALVKMLFSNKNLGTNMRDGFRGNPNIGSVVLNQFEYSQQFMDFATNFEDGDRIFIISSIFGGTGASGFPLLLKKLRELSKSPKINKGAIIEKAPIGAVTVLPYYQLEDPNKKPDSIDSSTFISKAKSALSYYKTNITNINVLYYIGDDMQAIYENYPGGANQKDKPSIVELASALAIVDFSNKHKDIKNDSSQSIKPKFKEFSIQSDVQIVNFKKLCRGTEIIIEKPLTMFTLFSKFLRDQITGSLNQPWAIGNPKIDDNYLPSNFFTDLNDFTNNYLDWLADLADDRGNRRAFSPFKMCNDAKGNKRIDDNKDAVFDLVDDFPPKKVLSLKSNYALYDNYLNDESKDARKNGTEINTADNYLLQLFYKATEKLSKDKLRI